MSILWKLEFQINCLLHLQAVIDTQKFWGPIAAPRWMCIEQMKTCWFAGEKVLNWENHDSYLRCKKSWIFCFLLSLYYTGIGVDSYYLPRPLILFPHDKIRQPTLICLHLAFWKRPELCLQTLSLHFSWLLSISDLSEANLFCEVFNNILIMIRLKPIDRLPGTDRHWNIYIYYLPF